MKISTAIKVESGADDIINMLLDSAMERVGVGCELNSQSCISSRIAGIALGRNNLESRKVAKMWRSTPNPNVMRNINM